jgi:DNA-binding NtrC family response regulator
MAQRLGLHCTTCGSLTEARRLVERRSFRLVLCSDELPDSNLRTSVRVLASVTGAPVIVLSHLADWDAYMKALRAGAFDYIACPPDPAEAERIFRLALQQSPPPRRAGRAAA